MALSIRSLVLSLVLTLITPLAAADEFSDTLARFRTAGAGAMLDGAYGYAVFPTIGKGGFGIGGAYGEGRVYSGGVLRGWANMTQLTIGLQLGGQAFSQLILFEDESAYRSFISGNFEFGAQATAVALTLSAGAGASTGGGAATSVGESADDAAVANAGYRKGMAIFTLAKGGLMYEASVGGQKFNYTPAD